ncbi:capsular polysaccharide biosynthesis protein [Methanobacterium lacus]|uniref:Capsular polysaccharide biosynthesis protein n=1 Tax=Methanobacterium lacus (strain AL-21) TaxID=877455 RepID=F0TBN4_METLA|nr:phenylacetate--CoA ligase family protein [Methanobacterium lacus]ADZ09111.1 capsular polysaccharide biosynthesis protein [Methanobacterium lacus]
MWRKQFIASYYSYQYKNIFENLKKYEKTQFWSLKELEKLQWKKLKNLIIYAYEYVPFYRKLYKSENIDPKDIKSPDQLKKLPIITKRDINDNINDMKSILCQDKDFIKNSSGGSTGENLFFYNDKNRLNIREALTIRGNKWAGLNLGVKNVYLWGSQFDISLQDRFLVKMYNKLAGTLFLSSFNLNDDKMGEYAKKIVKHSPQVLVAYPSSLNTFAQYINQNEILNIDINSIITSGETLFDYQRDLIESTFKCNIFNRYGCREFGPIAHECSEHMGMHLNMEHVYIQFLESKNCKYSNLIITDLDNYVMPFINYEIGDNGNIIEENCNCGRKLPLINIEGRIFDVIVGTNGNHIGGTFWTIFFRHINGIKQFQILQKNKNKIIIKIIVNADYKIEYTEKLINKLKSICGIEMKIEIIIVNEIPLPKSGKHRFIISNLKNK